jgi:hypothetical protein
VKEKTFSQRNLRGMTGKLGEASERGYVLRGRIKWAWQCKRGDRR